VPMKIVVLEENEDRQAVMRACLADRFYMYDIRFFDDASATIDFLDAHLADTLVVSLDNDLELKPGPDGRWLDPGSGRQVAEYLAGKEPTCPVIIHTSNTHAAAGTATLLRAAGWKTRRVVPFEDTRWIETDWFPAVRRAIVGAIKPPGRPRSRS
jgi:hypothetical protein